VVRDPRSVLAEFDFVLDPDVSVTVWDASAESRYLVLPRRPTGTEGLDERALADLVTRNGLIGTAPV
jgi:nitrile hydratase